MSETTLSNEALTAKEAKLKTKQDFIDKLLMRHAMGLAKKLSSTMKFLLALSLLLMGKLLVKALTSQSC